MEVGRRGDKTVSFPGLHMHTATSSLLCEVTRLQGFGQSFSFCLCPEVCLPSASETTFPACAFDLSVFTCSSDKQHQTPPVHVP